MLFSKSCEHAIRAVLYLAENRDTSFISIREIAEKSNISFHFLGKIVQILTKKGILNSYKGPNGGVSLARSPDEITLLQVVEAIDATNFSMDGCAMGTSHCDPDNPCVLHDNWSMVRKQIWEMLAVKSLMELVKTHKIF
jgi:Rrf2 family protein